MKPNNYALDARYNGLNVYVPLNPLEVCPDVSLWATLILEIGSDTKCKFCESKTVNSNGAPSAQTRIVNVINNKIW